VAVVASADESSPVESTAAESGPVQASAGEQPDTGQVINLIQGQTLAGKMGIKIIEASAQRVVGTMPVEGNTQPYGILHGGASCVLAETLGSVGSALHAGLDKFTVGIEINASHHRPAVAGLVTGVATQLHAGRTMATYDIVISDERGRRVCTARLSCLLRDAVPSGGTNPRAAGD
jgi:uncharacterized protein (TIGR00369 family)